MHYMTPEGSYATDPDGAERTLELRQMVQVRAETVMALASGTGQTRHDWPLRPQADSRKPNASVLWRACSNRINRHVTLRRLCMRPACESCWTWCTTTPSTQVNMPAIACLISALRVVSPSFTPRISENGLLMVSGLILVWSEPEHERDLERSQMLYRMLVLGYSCYTQA